jgi:hypothetical protein
MKIWALITVLIIFSLCISGSPQKTTPSETIPTMTTPAPSTEPPTTTPVQTTPAPVDKELELAQTLGLSGPATNYARGLDKDLEVNNNEGEFGKAYDKLYKENSIQPSTTKEILNIVYEGGMNDLEYLMEHVIDSNVFNEMIKNEFELYEKDLFGTIVETKEPFIISQYDIDPAEKLEIYEGIYDKPMNTKNSAEIPFFRKLKEKMFDEYNGSHLGHFRKDRDDGNWYWNLSDLVSVGKDGKIYLLYLGDILKSQKELDKKWEGRLTEHIYSEYSYPETYMDIDLKEFFEENDLVGKDLDLPFDSKKYIVVPRIYEDNEKKDKWGDIYSKHFALGIPETEGIYELYEFCVPYNPKNTIFNTAQGKVSNIDSNIDSYIYRPVGAPMGNWSNLVFKDNEYIPVIMHTFVPMEYKVSALAAIYFGLENFNEILDTGEKIKYIIG